tara:strand:- start:1907 stop:2560 length:654 start_codon:yes stop_codon:yes gene_type:complete
LQFSSTETYANRYDLDEISVFLEGNANNPMFFSVNGLPETLSFGKHYFNLSLLDTRNQEYQLRSNSQILFECKSINNVVIKSDVATLNQRNGIATCFIEVLENPLRSYKEIEDGQGTLTIVGSLENNQNTTNPISEKFIGAVNYRCIFPINIQKNSLNANSPFITNTTHEIKTLTGQFSFISDSLPSLSNDPNDGATYDNNGNRLSVQTTSTYGSTR